MRGVSTVPTGSGRPRRNGSRLLRSALLSGLWLILSAASSSAQIPPRDCLTLEDYDGPEVHRDDEPIVESVIGSFDEADRLHNQTEKTYKLPDIGVFAAYFPETGDLATGLSVELYDRKHRRGLINWFKWDLMVSEQRLGLAMGRKIFPVIDVTLSLVYSRDFDRHQEAWGFSVGLVKF